MGQNEDNDLIENLQKLRYETKPTRCEKCGYSVKYMGRGAYECEKCGFTMYDDFGLVDQFLSANGPSTAPAISRGTGLSIARVRELLEQGRLEALPGSEKMIDGGGDKTAEKAPKAKGQFVAHEPVDRGRIRFRDPRK